MCITVDLSDPCCLPDVRNVNQKYYTRTALTRATTVPVQTHDTTKHNAGTLVHRRRRRTPNGEASPPIGAHRRLPSAARERHTSRPHDRLPEVDIPIIILFSFPYPGHYQRAQRVPPRLHSRSQAFPTIYPLVMILQRQTWQINNNLRMVCSDDCPKTTRLVLSKNKLRSG